MNVERTENMISIVRQEVVAQEGAGVAKLTHMQMEVTTKIIQNMHISSL
jgi:hypothetical protein